MGPGHAAGGNRGSGLPSGDVGAVPLAWDPLRDAGPELVWPVVLVIVFLECGFLFGLVLPGESLLITAGVVLAQHEHEVSAWLLGFAAGGAAVLGNHVGYLFGARTLTVLAARRNGRLINQQNLDHAQAFLDRWGFWAVTSARWLPWIRTLIPPLAGAARMNQRKYLTASALGAIVWAPVMVLTGYYASDFLDRNPWIRTTVLVVFGVAMLVGTAVGLWRYRQEMHRPADEPGT